MPSIVSHSALVVFSRSEGLGVANSKCFGAPTEDLPGRKECIKNPAVKPIPGRNVPLPWKVKWTAPSWSWRIHLGKFKSEVFALGSIGELRNSSPGSKQPAGKCWGSRASKPWSGRASQIKGQWHVCQARSMAWGLEATEIVLDPKVDGGGHLLFSLPFLFLSLSLVFLYLLLKIYCKLDWKIRCFSDCCWIIAW